MQIEVLKIDETPDSTLSQMRVDDRFFCFIIEDGYREVKVSGQTRIPDGTYQIKKRTYGGFYEKYREKFGHRYSIEIADVSGFTDILIHIGNTIEDTRGCLLVADQAGRSGPNYVGTGGTSTTAYLRFYDAVEAAFEAGEEIEIKLMRDKQEEKQEPEPEVVKDTETDQQVIVQDIEPEVTVNNEEKEVGKKNRGCLASLFK